MGVLIVPTVTRVRFWLEEIPVMRMDKLQRLSGLSHCQANGLVCLSLLK